MANYLTASRSEIPAADSSWLSRNIGWITGGVAALGAAFFASQIPDLHISKVISSATGVIGIGAFAGGIRGALSSDVSVGEGLSDGLSHGILTGGLWLAGTVGGFMLSTTLGLDPMFGMAVGGLLGTGAASLISGQFNIASLITTAMFGAQSLAPAIVGLQNGIFAPSISPP